MTAPSTPREQRQRVSDQIQEECATSHYYKGSTVQLLSLDLYDARATIAQRDDEIAQLRGALATARRDALMIALDIVAKHEAGSHDPWQVQQDLVAEIEEEIRALAPPAAADGERDG